MTKPVFTIAGAVLALALTSCSMGFKRDWEKAAAQQHLPVGAAQAPTDLSGAWLGTWNSVATGHHGTLKAIATPLPADARAPTGYQFRYHATWAKFLSGGYTTTHTVTRQGKDYIIGGEHDLGRLLGGVYKYEGKATPTHFRATYTSNLDNGVFELQRPSGLPWSLPGPIAPAR